MGVPDCLRASHSFKQRLNQLKSDRRAFTGGLLLCALGINLHYQVATIAHQRISAESDGKRARLKSLTSAALEREYWMRDSGE